MNDQTQALKDYIGGMKRHNRAALMQLRGIHNWHAAAQHELERRAYLVLNTFNDDLMLAIANGEVNVQQAIDEVLAD
ncbi:MULTISPECIES: hypothetical protein [unclassified Lysobacter]|uniref:hypothetical protein n=1 Tax=unclassified Lysobacter TaxID=2635362 RepID=UPI001BEBC98A|nr:MULTISPECIES: hypothetical protein [unclassified Lysobacter]MBT2746182.1 hypothetical protein [Lysobacter sp. ISL-42]MBT2750727.1 hypothetical protein [Lysobacter sp. ISL-50]MBT2776126.1 hypothetical protein [Lysobacter sp. ISL-54]MBT2784632.1 hypothetical protein [Lysobacter sp. ISL-52]